MVQWIAFSDNKESLFVIENIFNNSNVSLELIINKDELSKTLQKNENTILFIGESSTYNIYECCREISTLYPFISIILVVSENNLDLKLAMRSSALDVIASSSDEREILKTLQEAEKIHKLKFGNVEKTNKRPQYKEGRVITVCSTKGGVGKTTLVTNLAAAVAKEKQKVAIVDLNLQFGDIPMFFDIKPKRTIYEWVKEDFGQQTQNIQNYLHEHESGTYILSAPIRPEFSEVINEEHVESLIETLQRQFDYIFIDTPSYLTGTCLTALEMSHDILLMTYMDLPTIKNSKVLVEILESLGLKEKIKVILNRETKVKGIQLEAVEKILGLPFFSRIPNNEKVVIPSVNEGKPLVITTPKTPVGKSILSLKTALMPVQQQSGKKKFRKVPVEQNV